MKKTFQTCLVALGVSLLTACSNDSKSSIDDLTSEKTKFELAVASDLHYFNAEKLLEKEGKAFNDFIKEDRKLFRESDAILDHLLEQVIEKKPQVFIIPGDLTKDGEKINHEGLAQKLRMVEKAGIKVYVIPGNHDINNPHAWYFNGNVSRPAEQITPEEFAEIYGDFGYNPSEHIERGPELCYVAEPVEGLWLIGIDACIYKNNIAENYPRTGGALDETRLKWITSKIKEGKSRGKQVIAMMHHGLVEHFNLQSLVASDYLVDNFIGVGERLSSAGLQFIFTGHAHSQDIAGAKFNNKSLYDIQTGSSLTFPCPYRTVTITDTHLKVRSHDIKMNNELTNFKELRQYAYDDVYSTIFVTMDAILDSNNTNLGTDVIFKIVKFIRDVYKDDLRSLIVEIYTNMSKGDENGVKSTYYDREAGKDLSSMELLKYIFDSKSTRPAFTQLEKMTYDSYPADNNIDILLEK